jgi:hypothetical protein
MAETSEEAQFRIVPQLFFDLISSYIPGVAMIICIVAAVPSRARAEWLADAEKWMTGDAISGRGILGIVATVLVPYAIGVLLGWLSYLIETLGVKRSAFVVPPDEQGKNGSSPTALHQRHAFYRLPRDIRDRIEREPAEDRAILLYRWYDYLRLHHPHAGALAVKLRAEMVMYAAFIAVAVVGLAVHIIAWWWFGGGWHWPFVFIVVACGVSTYFKWQQHATAWQYAVANFYALTGLLKEAEHEASLKRNPGGANL